MKEKILLIVLTTALAGCQSSLRDVPMGVDSLPKVTSSQITPPVFSEYRIGVMDEISVNVFDEPELGLKNGIVDASGSIFLPLIGKVVANGRTAEELSEEITSRYNERYLKKTQVSVNVVNPVNYAFSIDGRVKKPGRYKIPGQLTLAQAIAVGEGAAGDAKLSEVLIIRKMDGQVYAAKFDVKAIYSGRQQDPSILPGDIVVVGLDKAEALFKDLIPLVATLGSLFVVISQQN